MTEAPPKRLLIIDDDRGLCRLMERAFRREGWEARSAYSGAEARQALLAEKPDLALVDLQLEDITGQELVSQTELGSESAPFIVITGQGDASVAVEMMKRGALDYVIKDARFLDFVAPVVARALEQLERERRLAQAEHALQQENAFTKAVLDTTGALIVALRTDGSIVRANRAFEQLAVARGAELHGQNFTEFLGSGEVSALRAVWDRLREQSGVVEHQTHLQLPDGGRRLVAWACSTLGGIGGEADHILMTGADISERKRLEEELIEITGRERREIGSDLHDGICQQLSAVQLLAEALEQNLKRNKSAAQQAHRIAEYIRNTIVSTKNLARGLVPVELEAHGLMSALEELCAFFTNVYGIQCDFRPEGSVLLESHIKATHLYRIAQEAVSNAIRHVKASKVLVELKRADGSIILTITDNGPGFPPEGASRKGMGLRIMQYRAAMIAGSIQFTNPPHGGARVTCVVSEKNG